jgi:hypothetical protein
MYYNNYVVSSKKWHSLQLISGGLLVITSYLNTLDGYYTRFLGGAEQVRHVHLE